MLTGRVRLVMGGKVENILQQTKRYSFCDHSFERLFSPFPEMVRGWFKSSNVGMFGGETGPRMLQVLGLAFKFT